MKKIFIISIIALNYLGAGTAFAQNSDAHDHSAGQASDPSQNEMMGQHMDMSHMQGMMAECMKNHKDQKMCNHQMMEQCQSNMSQGDCQKMMKNMKAKKK